MPEKKVFDMKVFFNPKNNQYRVDITGNKNMPAKDLIGMMEILTNSLESKECKTMGEYIEKQNASHETV